MEKFVALMLVKKESKRLKNKNTKDFKGKPMFMWNLEKSLEIFDEVYVSSDSTEILDMAEAVGGIPILREEELCGDCPDIPVFQHALSEMSSEVEGLVAVHADTPLLDEKLIVLSKELLSLGVQEIMTCRPMARKKEYKEQYNGIYGSIRAMTVDRLRNYPDPYKPNPEVLLVDNSLEIETQKDFDKAERL